MRVGEIARAVEKDGAGEVLWEAEVSRAVEASRVAEVSREAEVSWAAEVDCSGEVAREVRLVRFVEVEGVASELGGSPLFVNFPDLSRSGWFFLGNFGSCFDSFESCFGAIEEVT
jgi:hypothetical protein